MTAGVVMPVSTRVALESPVSSEMNEEDESPEADLDYLDEYDSEEERRQRKKRKVRFDTHYSSPTAISISCTVMYCVQAVTKSRPVAAAVITPQRVSTRDHEKDKPFACKCKLWKCNNSKRVASTPHTYSSSSETHSPHFFDLSSLQKAL